MQERRFEATGRDLEGRRFPVEMSVGRADDTAEAIYVAYVRDITRRKTDEHALTEARDRALAGERAKSEFVAVMSHEMRTPLNGLLGSLQLLRDHSLTERQTELLDGMEGSGRLLLGLVWSRPRELEDRSRRSCPRDANGARARPLRSAGFECAKMTPRDGRTSSPMSWSRDFWTASSPSRPFSKPWPSLARRSRGRRGTENRGIGTPGRAVSHLAASASAYARPRDGLGRGRRATL
ncbi:hypothetical protein LVO79_11575 [Roseivivax marinus]|uniref:histidine kinase dimerization/phospho-acceptor domain-containing protein n=1 Tax=Roseivivax marinus TaxID=1379903 RepID=UPI001F049999|nr:histidine kinase dimerization/phospho-acceptor domain-containing protein [Roseivivax marinus]UMA63673.1 hypothetical protein LVO79_11575 [Roseivivax marinus]